MILSNETANLVSKSKVKNGKEAIEKIRKFFRSEIEAEDFYSLVKQIYKEKDKIDTVFAMVTDYNTEEDGIRLNQSFDNKFLKMIHVSACQLTIPQR